MQTTYKPNIKSAIYTCTNGKKFIHHTMKLVTPDEKL